MTFAAGFLAGVLFVVIVAFATVAYIMRDVD